MYYRECKVGSFPYVINPGDTLLKIAARFGTNVASILAANTGIDPSKLQIGQTICITPPTPPNIFCSSSNYYVVMEGDTLYKISQYFNTSIPEISSMNPGLNPNNMRPGQVICLPLRSSPVNISVDIKNKSLTLFRGTQILKKYPIATGKPATPSPIGRFTIVYKQVNPGGPYGTRWMGLSIPTYGIHGTSNPSSIGTAASNGCIRMHNKYVNELFNLVPIGTFVRIF